jgi:serine/threonine protein kinase
VIFNIVKKDPPPINKKWSANFQDFVKKCLTKDPNNRPEAKALLDHPFLKNADSH